MPIEVNYYNKNESLNNSIFNSLLISKDLASRTLYKSVVNNLDTNMLRKNVGKIREGEKSCVQKSDEIHYIITSQTSYKTLMKKLEQFI